MSKINISNFVTNVKTTGEDKTLGNKKKSAVEEIETTKKIPLAKQDYIQNTNIKKMSPSKINPRNNNLIAKTKKTTKNSTDLTNKISQTTQLNNFYKNNFDFLSADITAQLNETQNSAEKLAIFNINTMKNFETKYAKELKFIKKFETTGILNEPHTSLHVPSKILENFIYSPKNDANEKFQIAKKFVTDFKATDVFETYQRYKKQEGEFNTEFNNLITLNNEQMKILKPYMAKKHTRLQEMNREITKKVKNKSTAKELYRLIEDKDLLQKQYDTYKETVNMLKNSKTHNKSLDDDVKKLDSKIKKLTNKKKKLNNASNYNTQENKNNLTQLTSDLKKATKERGNLNDKIFKMTSIELKNIGSVHKSVSYVKL